MDGFVARGGVSAGAGGKPLHAALYAGACLDSI